MWKVIAIVAIGLLMTISLAAADTFLGLHSLDGEKSTLVDMGENIYCPPYFKDLHFSGAVASGIEACQYENARKNFHIELFVNNSIIYLPDVLQKGNEWEKNVYSFQCISKNPIVCPFRPKAQLREGKIFTDQEIRKTLLPIDQVEKEIKKAMDWGDAILYAKYHKLR